MRGKPYMPWPAAPKPMPGEVFGSWLGRVAARYRIGVDELNSASQIEVEIGQGAEAWLAARPVGAATIEPNVNGADGTVAGGRCCKKVVAQPATRAVTAA